MKQQLASRSRLPDGRPPRYAARWPWLLALLPALCFVLLLAGASPAAQADPSVPAPIPTDPLPDKFLFAIGGQAPVGQFNGLRAVAVAPDGTIYVADTGNDRIQRVTAAGTFLGTWGSQGSGD